MNLLTQLLAGAKDVELADNLNLTSLCSLMVFCLATASITHFLDKCMEKGMIFREYYNWITYWLWLSKKRFYRISDDNGFFGYACHVSDRNIKHVEVTEVEFNNRSVPALFLGAIDYTFKIKFILNKKVWLWKMIGGCIYCFGTWVFIVLFIASVFNIQHLRLSLIGLILGIAFNYLFIEVIQRIKK